MPAIPVEGAKIKAKPWPGRKCLTFAMEKMKEVEKERDVEEFVRILEGYKARPMEKVVSSVTARMEDWTVAFPKRRRLVELKLVLKMNSVPEVAPRRSTSVIVKRRGRAGEDILEREFRLAR